MRSGRRCPENSPAWLEVLDHGRQEHLGYRSVAVHGWRRGLLASLPLPLRLGLLDRWLSRYARGPNGFGDDGPPEAGVREPRRPSPFAGAGAVALPEPDPTT